MKFVRLLAAFTTPAGGGVEVGGNFRLADGLPLGLAHGERLAAEDFRVLPWDTSCLTEIIC